jgi:hypothetical protein
MNLELVAHASLKINNSSNKVLITDPWYKSPVYWGSWFLCPEPKVDDNIYQTTNFIYLTHWHFDHFDYKTMRSFNKNIKIFVPKFPSSIMKQELINLGFNNICEMGHNKEYLLDKNFSIISHQVEHQDDSILIIKVDNKIIVNLNDAKPLPSSWKWLVKNFKNPDFMFRSHSLAWSYPTKYTFDKMDEDFLKKETYMREFLQCIIFLEPKYAVPFASYICHLHKETLNDNQHLTTPYELESFIKANYKSKTLFKIINPGGKYSDANGFYDIKDYNFHEELEFLKKKYSSYLDNLYKKESQHQTDFPLVKKYFEDFISNIGILRFTLKNFIWIIDTKDEKIMINFSSKQIKLLESFDENITKFSAIIYVDKSVLNRSLKNYIFSNIDISKRWNVKISKGNVQKHLYLTNLITLYEGRIIPVLPNLLKARFITGYLRRLPELIDYFKVFLKLRKSVSEARSYISGVEQK